jgi:preprotein translocase subunit SecY
MWLGELVSEQGIGNGISLLIFAGIISSLPSTVGLVIKSIFTKDAKFVLFDKFTLPVSGRALALGCVMLVATIILAYIMVKLNEAQRTITISYAKRVSGNQAYGGVDSVLPIKLIGAGVVPIIFAVAFLSLPSFVGNFLQNSAKPGLQTLGRDLLTWFQSPTGGTPTTGKAALIYPIAYFILVVAFTFFYTSITFNTKEIAENLQKQGGFVPGVRPGLQTEKHLQGIVTRLTLFGALALGLLALLPILVERLLGTSQLALSGTGVLIIISVALETLRQVESRALMVSYDNY